MKIEGRKSGSVRIARPILHSRTLEVRKYVYKIRKLVLIYYTLQNCYNNELSSSLRCLHLVADVCTSSSSVIWRAIWKVFDHITYTGLQLQLLCCYLLNYIAYEYTPIVYVNNP